jgi:hypothetical protein
MTGSRALGPLAFPYSPVLVACMVGTAALVASRTGKKNGVDVEPVPWKTVLIGIVVARLGFVCEFRSAYFDAPLSILGIRDGGWSPVARLPSQALGRGCHEDACHVKQARPPCPAPARAAHSRRAQAG